MIKDEFESLKRYAKELEALKNYAQVKRERDSLAEESAGLKDKVVQALCYAHYGYREG